MKLIRNNMKVVTQMTIGFGVITALLVFSLYAGYTTADTIIKESDPEGYLRSYSYFTAVLFIVMTIIVTGIIVTIRKIIEGSLKQLKNVADCLAEGDVNVEIKIEAMNEFGQVLDDFNKVVENVKYQSSIAQEVADGNMLIEVEPKSEKDVMGNALKQMVDKNRETLQAISMAAEQVTSGASQVASASDALAEGSTDQASSIEEITASIADVAEKTRVNATHANEAADLMGQAIVEVNKGNEEMKDMMVAMDEINKASENISKIIKVIDDIAFQTNILALNAAVEAARAGEAGKGFAVVAEEVRNLAAKSASAASETAELIEDSIRKINMGSKLASETEQALVNITNVVQRSEQIVTDIATASNYQASAIAQIDQAVEQVSYVVQTNSATSEECAAASQELLEQAAKVKELISAYNI